MSVLSLIQQHARALIRSRLLSFGMVLGVGFLLMVSLVFHAAMEALGKWWGPALGDGKILAQTINALISFALTASISAMIYKIMPRAEGEEDVKRRP